MHHSNKCQSINRDSSINRSNWPQSTKLSINQWLNRLIYLRIKQTNNQSLILNHFNQSINQWITRFTTGSCSTSVYSDILWYRVVECWDVPQGPTPRCLPGPGARTSNFHRALNERSGFHVSLASAHCTTHSGSPSEPTVDGIKLLTIKQCRFFLC